MKTIVLETGEKIPAQMVIIGEGNKIDDQMAKEAGLLIDSKLGGVKTNPFLQTSCQDIFAAGEIASYPSWYVGQNIRSKNQVTGMSQGSYSALNMLGKLIPFSNVPFQQTVIYGKNLQYIGHATQWDEIHIDGSTKDGKFIAYYIKDNNILAALGQNRSGDILVLFEAMS